MTEDFFTLIGVATVGILMVVIPAIRMQRLESVVGCLIAQVTDYLQSKKEDLSDEEE